MATVLIAEDAPFMTSSLKIIIEGAGHQVIGTASSGVHAVELYKEHRPDLVTVDVLMPEMDGIEALTAIRALDPHAKVVMVSAHGQEQEQERARSIGAVGYIRKPFSQAGVNEEIDRVLTSSGPLADTGS